MSIYFDHAATTPVSESVLNKMLPFFSAKFGNASSVHNFGHEALLAVDEARGTIKNFFNCEVDEIVFTSGATEANNLCLSGIIKSAKSREIEVPKIIISDIEHPSVIETCKELEGQGVTLEYLKVNKDGLVSVEDLVAKIDENTVLVSIMYVNNEIGSIQPIRELGKAIKKINENNDKAWRQAKVDKRGTRPNKIVFHTDATQAIRYLNCDMDWNYIDALTFSGHKIYGPKGIGALICKANVEIEPIIFGGGQEGGKRSGTLNVPGIVGLGKSIDDIKKFSQPMDLKKIEDLRQSLVDKISSEFFDIVLNGNYEKALPNIINFRIKNINAESLMIALDMKGIGISTGSACSLSKLTYSHVLNAIGLNADEARSSIRVSLGNASTEDEVTQFAAILKEVILQIKNLK